MVRVMLILLLTLSSILAGCTQNQSRPVQIQEYSKHKAVVIVVDSLMDQSLQYAMKHTQLPAFRFLLNKGHYIPDVVSSFPSMTVSVMSTLVTGEFPDRHRVPGLIWMDWDKKRVVNYGNNAAQTVKLGVRSVARDVLYDLNETHLSKETTTIFEDLKDSGYRTETVNMLLYRGRTPHSLIIPFYLRPFLDNQASHQVMGPDTLVLGRFSKQDEQKKTVLFNPLGLTDRMSTNALIDQIKQGKLPDFTMVYFPDNDRHVHKAGVYDLKGITQVDQNLQKVLGSYGDWQKTLQNLTLIVMGDSGSSSVLQKNQNPTIMIGSLFPDKIIYRWGKRAAKQEDLAFAVNSRMAYVYLLAPQLETNEVVKRLAKEDRIDSIAWLEGDSVCVTNPENKGRTFLYRKGGAVKDRYDQSWDLVGSYDILDLKVEKNGRLNYGKYPDALQQLWSALHSQKGKYLIVTAKAGYQFGDDHSPLHDGGAQQASLLKEDVYAPMIIAGTDQLPPFPVRFVDLKKYFISIVKGKNTM